MSFHLFSDSESLPETTKMPDTNDRCQNLSSPPLTYHYDIFRIDQARIYHIREISRELVSSKRDRKDRKDLIAFHKRKIMELCREKFEVFVRARVLWLRYEIERLEAKAANARKELECVGAERARLRRRARHNFRNRTLEEEDEPSDAAAAMTQRPIAPVYGPKTLEQFIEEIEEQRQRFLPSEPRQFTMQQEADGRKKVKRMLETLNNNQKEHGECTTQILGTDEEGRVKVRRTWGSGIVRDVRWSPLVKDPVAETGTGAQGDGVQEQGSAGSSMQ
jgi:hypothetical protein